MAGAIGLMALFAFALIWLRRALGLAAKTVETASNTPMVLTLLPFLSSGFVPSPAMPAGLRQFAEHQPFTPVTERTRTARRYRGRDEAIAAITCGARHWSWQAPARPGAFTTRRRAASALGAPRPAGATRPEAPAACLSRGRGWGAARTAPPAGPSPRA